MKKMITIIIFLTIKTVSFGQEEASYYVNKDDYLYKKFNSNSYETNGKIYEGEPIINIEGKLNIVSSDDKKTKRVKVQTKNNEGWLYTNSISIGDSEILPGEITENEWTNSYYFDVMRQGNRDALFAYEPFWRDYFYKYRDGYTIYEPKEWYEIVDIPSFEFRNIYANLYFSSYNEYTFIFGKISKNNGAFSFQATCTDTRIEYNEKETGVSFNLNGEYNMMLKLDGDYLDVYINGKKISSLVKLTKGIKEEFENLLEYNKCDLTYITLPKRADGSMDYPQSVKANAQDNTDNNSLTENTKNNSEASPMPLWTWFAIIGGAVVVVGGGTVVFLIKRRK
jgi:hypothetical protein